MPRPLLNGRYEIRPGVMIDHEARPFQKKYIPIIRRPDGSRVANTHDGQFYFPPPKFGRAVQSSMRQSLKAKRPRQSKWEGLVGYDVGALRCRLESLFSQGMSWENMSAWEIDHIRPLCTFHITSFDCADFKAAWALSNLQPLWAPDNRRKGGKWSGDV